MAFCRILLQNHFFVIYAVLLQNMFPYNSRALKKIVPMEKKMRYGLHKIDQTESKPKSSHNNSEIVASQSML